MPQPNDSPAQRAPDEAADRVRGRLMAQSLMQLLDRVRGAREVLPHLAALERALLERGAMAIDMVPAKGLGKICSQLLSLPLPPDDPVLRDLLRRLLGAQEALRAPPAYGDFDPERTVVVREVSHSEFDAASVEQASTMQGPG
jgi:hypothetical protein